VHLGQGDNVSVQVHPREQPGDSCHERLNGSSFAPGLPDLRVEHLNENVLQQQTRDEVQPGDNVSGRLKALSSFVDFVRYRKGDANREVSHKHK